MSNVRASIPIETIVKERISHLFDCFESRRIKSRLSRKFSQRVLEEEGDALVKEMFEAFKERVERYSEMVVHHFKVDRTKARQQMIDDTGRVQCIRNEDVLATMPIDGPEEGDLYFFPLKRYHYLSATKVAEEFESRYLVPDPFAQIQVNTDHPKFAGTHPNGVQWIFRDYCYITFFEYGQERRVLVGRGINIQRLGDDWGSHWWFAGRRK